MEIMEVICWSWLRPRRRSRLGERRQDQDSWNFEPKSEAVNSILTSLLNRIEWYMSRLYWHVDTLDWDIFVDGLIQYWKIHFMTGRDCLRLLTIWPGFFSQTHKPNCRESHLRLLLSKKIIQEFSWQFGRDLKLRLSKPNVECHIRYFSWQWQNQNLILLRHLSLTITTK